MLALIMFFATRTLLADDKFLYPGVENRILELSKSTQSLIKDFRQAHGAEKRALGRKIFQANLEPYLSFYIFFQQLDEKNDIEAVREALYDQFREKPESFDSLMHVSLIETVMYREIAVAVFHSFDHDRFWKSMSDIGKAPYDASLIAPLVPSVGHDETAVPFLVSLLTSTEGHMPIAENREFYAYHRGNLTDALSKLGPDRAARELIGRLNEPKGSLLEDSRDAYESAMVALANHSPGLVIPLLKTSIRDAESAKKAGSLETFKRILAKSDCATVHMDEAGGSLEHVPFLNQKDYGVCYGMAAAQLFEAYLESHSSQSNDEKRQQVSYLEGIFGAGAGDPERCQADMESGDDQQVLEYLIRHGACDAATLRAQIPMHDNPADVIAALKDLTAQAFLRNEIEEAEKEKKRTEDLKKALLAHQAKYGDLLVGLPEEIYRGIKKKGDAAQFIYSYLTSICNRSKRRKLPAGVGTVNYHRGFDTLYDFYHTQSILEKMQSLLNGSSPVQPFSIWIPSRFLRLPKSVERDPDNRRGTHILIVAGRRYNAERGECQLMLRDSYGKGCQDYYAKDWDCDPKTGRLWVSLSSLASATREITYLSDREPPPSPLLRKFTPPEHWNLPK
jgi:hypothetical protein